MVGHSHIALSHEECRGRLCTCCGFKLSTSSVMSAAAEALVRQFGPHPAYDSSILFYPTGLCSTCQHCLYKIRAGTPVKAWGGPQPPSWAQFNIETIYGVRKCGTTDQQGEVTMCDLCSHIRFNPAGTIYNGKQATALKSRRIEEPPATPENLDSVSDLCSICLSMKWSGVPHPCGPAQKKRNLLGILQESPENEQKAVMGSAVTMMARSETQQSTREVVTLGRVEGGHSITVKFCNCL